jgi:hypothetical protein
MIDRGHLLIALFPGPGRQPSEKDTGAYCDNQSIERFVSGIFKYLSFHPLPPFLAHLVRSLLRVLLGTFYVIDRSIQLLVCCLGSPGDFLSCTLPNLSLSLR